MKAHKGGSHCETDLRACVSVVVCEQHSCDGKRDRTKYVEMKQFTDANLSSGSY